MSSTENLQTVVLDRSITVQYFVNSGYKKLSSNRRIFVAVKVTHASKTIWFGISLINDENQLTIQLRSLDSGHTALLFHLSWQDEDKNGHVRNSLIALLYFRLIKIHLAREKMILFLYIGHFLLIPLTDIQEILSSDESISERTSRRLLLLLSVKFLLRWLIDLIVFIVHMHKSSGDLSDELRTLAPFLLTIVRAKFRVRYVQMTFRSSDCHVHQSTYSTRQIQCWEKKERTDVLLPRHSCRRNSKEIDFELEDSIVLIFVT